MPKYGGGQTLPIYPQFIKTACLTVQAINRVAVNVYNTDAASPIFKIDTSTNTITINGTLSGTAVTAVGAATAASLFQLNSGATDNSRDIGYYGKYISSATTYYTGIYRDRSTAIFNVFDSYTSAITNTVTTAGLTYASMSMDTLYVGNGAIGSPSIKFRNSTSTGMYRSAADQISFVNAGVESLRCDASGNTTVLGNLIVNGTSTTVNSSVVNVADNIITMGSGNVADSLDLGMCFQYVSSGTKYGALYRASGTDNWYIKNAITSAPGNTVSGGSLANLVVNQLTGTVATAVQASITTLANVTTVGSLSLSTGKMTLSGSSTAVSEVFTGEGTNSIVGAILSPTLAPAAATPGNVLCGAWINPTFTCAGVQFGDIDTAISLRVSNGSITSLGTVGIQTGVQIDTFTGTVSTLDTCIGLYCKAQTAGSLNYAAYFESAIAVQGHIKIPTIPGLDNTLDIGSGSYRFANLYSTNVYSTSLTGTLATASQPNVTTLGGLISMNSITVGAGTLSGLTSVISSGFRLSTSPTVNYYIKADASGNMSWANPATDFVTAITGTANQVIASTGVGSITLSLPQSIATSSSPSFAGLTLSGTLSANADNTLDIGAVATRFANVYSTSFTGTLATASQPNVTTLGGLTSMNSITVGTGTLSGLTSIISSGIRLTTSPTVNYYIKADSSGNMSWANPAADLVTAITGTANQVVASAGVGSITLSLPQSIATSSVVQFGRIGVNMASTSTFDATLATATGAQFTTSGSTLHTGTIFSGSIAQTDDGTASGVSYHMKINPAFAPPLGAIASYNMLLTTEYAVPTTKTIGFAYGLYSVSKFDNAAFLGTVTNLYNAYIASSGSLNSGAVVTNSWGLYVADQTVGTNKYCAQFAGTVYINSGTPNSLTTPIMDIQGTSTRSILYYSGAGVTPTLVMRHAAGSLGSLTATLSGVSMGSYEARGYYTSAFTSSANASIKFVAAENFTSTAHGTYMSFSTTGATTTTLNEVMRINQNGGVAIGSSYVGTLPPASGLIVSGAVAVGTSAPNAYNILQVAGSLTATTAKAIGIMVDTLTLTAAATSDTFAAIRSNVITLATGASSFTGLVFRNMQAANSQVAKTGNGVFSNAYGFYSDAFSSIATNQYAGYFIAPTGGTVNTALYAENLAVGTYTTTTPPSGGAIFSGNVGINNTAPGNRLEVSDTIIISAGTSSTTGYIRYISTGSVNYIQSGLTASSGSAAPLVFTNMYNAAEWGRFTATGQFAHGGGSPGSTVFHQIYPSTSFAYGTYLTGPLQGVGGVTDCVGLFVRPALTGAAATSGINCKGMYLSPTYVAGAQTTTFFMGLHIDGASMSGSGTAPTNSYALYCDTPAYGTNRYCAFFGGNVSIGTVSPYSNMQFYNQSSGTTQTGTFSSTVSTRAASWWGNGSNSFGFGIDTNNNAALFNNINSVSAVWNITSAGNLSINSASNTSNMLNLTSGNMQIYESANTARSITIQRSGVVLAQFDTSNGGCSLYNPGGTDVYFGNSSGTFMNYRGTGLSLGQSTTGASQTLTVVTSTAVGASFSTSNNATTYYALQNIGLINQTDNGAGSGAQIGYLNQCQYAPVLGASGLFHEYLNPIYRIPTTKTVSAAYNIYASPTYNNSAFLGTITNAYNCYIGAGTAKYASATISAAWGLYVENPTAGATNYCAYFGGNVGIGVATTAYQLELSTNSAGKPTSTTWTVTSDQRIKNNIQDVPLTECMELINGLRIRSFGYHPVYAAACKIPDAERYGLIAQEVEVVAPYCINTIPYQKYTHPETGEVYELENLKTLDADELNYAVIGSAQYLFNKNAQLDAKLNALDARMAELEADNKIMHIDNTLLKSQLQTDNITLKSAIQDLKASVAQLQARLDAKDAKFAEFRAAIKK